MSRRPWPRAGADDGSPRRPAGAIVWALAAALIAVIAACRPDPAAVLQRAEAGDVAAQVDVAKGYADKGPEQDLAKAVGWYRKAAEQGHGEAQEKLAEIYNRQGPFQDSVAAFGLFAKAAEHGRPLARYMLAEMHADGNGTKKDAAAALGYYRMAAEQGVTMAQHQLASFYLKGDGVPKDEVQAFGWNQRAAKGGNVFAQVQLARSYASGTGVTPNAAEALKWFRLAAEAGYHEGQFGLAAMYWKGEKGIARDLDGAAKWAWRAALQGQPQAQMLLGLLHMNGEGVTKDLVESHAWFTVVGDPEIRVPLLAAAAQTMDAAQLERAKERAAELREQVKHEAILTMPFLENEAATASPISRLGPAWVLWTAFVAGLLAIGAAALLLKRRKASRGAVEDSDGR